MIIEAINPPYVMARDEEKLDRYHLSEFESPRVGKTYELKDGFYRVTGNNIDVDCVGGACPIK